MNTQQFDYRIKKSGSTVRFVFVVFLLLTLQCMPRVVLSEEDPLIIGFFPRRNLTTTIKIFTPLARYLSSELGREVKVATTKNFKEFWEGVEQQKFDLVHYNQYHYIKSHKEKGYDVILKNEEMQRSTIAGSLIVRKDSGIEKITDLKGKKVVFGGGRKAMQSYIVAKYLLKKGGLNDGEYLEEFSINPVNAIMAAYFGGADAGGSARENLYLNAVTSKINIEELRYLAVGEQLAHLPWAVKGSLDKPLKKKLQKLLSGLSQSEEGRDILSKANLTGLVTASDNEYDPHRKIVYEVLGEKY